MIELRKIISDKTAKQDKTQQLQALRKSLSILQRTHYYSINDSTKLFFKRILSFAERHQAILRVREFKELSEIAGVFLQVDALPQTIVEAVKKQDFEGFIRYKRIQQLFDETWDSNRKEKRGITEIDEIRKALNSDVREEAAYLKKIIGEFKCSEYGVVDVTPTTKVYLDVRHVQHTFKLTKLTFDSLKQLYLKLRETSEKIKSAVNNALSAYKKTAITAPRVFRECGYLEEEKMIVHVYRDFSAEVEHYILVTPPKGWHGFRVYNDKIIADDPAFESRAFADLCKTISESNERYVILNMEGRLWIHNDNFGFWRHRFYHHPTGKVYRVSDKLWNRVRPYERYGDSIALFKIAKITEKSVWLEPIDVSQIINRR